MCAVKQSKIEKKKKIQFTMLHYVEGILQKLSNYTNYKNKSHCKIKMFGCLEHMIRQSWFSTGSKNKLVQSGVDNY